MIRPLASAGGGGGGWYFEIIAPIPLCQRLKKFYGWSPTGLDPHPILCLIVCSGFFSVALVTSLFELYELKNAGLEEAIPTRSTLYLSVDPQCTGFAFRFEHRK